MSVTHLLYRFGLGAYHTGVHVAARLGNGRAQQWVNGRRLDHHAQIKTLHRAGRPILWLHAASLGEFEQGRPVLAALRQVRPDWAVVLTFFSPSGYERCKDTELAEVVAYLPEDTPARAAEWTALLRPRLAIFVKYEFWYYHLRALQRAGVPTFLIAGSFRREQPFFRWYGKWWREMLTSYTHLAVQTEVDRQLLAELDVTNVTVTGDPRIDRTLALAEAPFTDRRLADFTSRGPTLLAGSVWPADVEVLLTAWNGGLRDDWQLILAPHQLQEIQVRQWQEQFAADRYTGVDTGSRVLLLDTIGILSRAYRYARVAYVGGAFGSGLHNTLEPMSYGLPVLFGPQYHKFPEAVRAVGRGGAFSVATGEELLQQIQQLQHQQAYDRSEQAQRSYLAENRGAAAKTASLLLRLLACLLLCLPLAAQSWAPADEMSEVLDGVFTKCNLMVAVSGVDWRPGLCMAAAQVEFDQTVSLQLDLEEGYRYVFIASTNGGGADIDLRLSNDRDSLLAFDTQPDQTPVVEYAVERSGTYVVQLHLAEHQSTGAVAVGLGILQTYGHPLPDRSYREANRQLGAAAGAVRAAGGASRFRSGQNAWCVLGYHLRDDRGATIDNLYLATGDYFFIAAGDDDARNLDLLLADEQLNIVRSDRDSDAYPMIEYSVTEPAPYYLRLEAERASQDGLILLAILAK